MMAADSIGARLDRLVAGRLHAPFEILGPQHDDGGARLRVYLPGARTVQLVGGAAFHATRWPGVFEAPAAGTAHYRLRWTTAAGRVEEAYDPYSFPVTIDATDLSRINDGRHLAVHRQLGAHAMRIDGIEGFRFAVWAPNAERVSVVGDFNGWDGRRHPMQALGASGIWCLFLPELEAGACYKFEIRSATGSVLLKSDPFAQGYQIRPETASVLEARSEHTWQDEGWMAERAARNPQAAPVSIYEVHLGSWQRAADGAFLGYRELATRLAPYVRDLGFTHVELLPVTEHPFDGSWGYQTLGYFAPTRRFGTPDDFRWFVDHLHNAGIGVLLDWTPAHFPRDAHGLARFDGTALYEHDDPRRGEHPDWDTLIFNYGRNEVRGFLTASALCWLKDFHVDGLRVDAVASMLYLDYSRAAGEWEPNVYGGNENLEAIAWLRELNEVTHREAPGCLMIAEESTAWPQVTAPTYLGGLGFTLKWNMGWMNDTLDYLSHDPVHRSYHHDRLTFGLLYAFSEHFVLPLSHDEVVHGKASLLAKMPGDHWQRFANLRLLYVFQFTYPGKKLLFMGGEHAQWREWDHDRVLDWALTSDAAHRGVFNLVRDLNHLYRTAQALGDDSTAQGFEWIDCHDSANSVISYVRRHEGDQLVTVLNFTPVVRRGYRIGVAQPGTYREVLNSDSALYGGSNVGNLGEIGTDATPWMGHPQSLALTLPPLAAIVLRRVVSTPPDAGSGD